MQPRVRWTFQRYPISTIPLHCEILKATMPSCNHGLFSIQCITQSSKIQRTCPRHKLLERRRSVLSQLEACITRINQRTVAMDSSPFYTRPPLKFRGIADGLAKSHLDGSECCLIHADNPLSSKKGVYLNPNVRVGYHPAAYAAVNTAGNSWLSGFSIFMGLWKNRILRTFTTPWFKESIVERRLSRWEEQYSENIEPGPFCLVNEMQVLTFNGWGHR